MTLAPRLQNYLDTLDADYELIEHSPTTSAIQNAALCHVPPDRIAKAVLLDTLDDYLLAVLPSDRRVDLADLRSQLGAKPRLADESEVAIIFEDCALGAVPPLGFGYGVTTIVDDALDGAPDIYFEGGDHVSLVHMDQAEFARLTRPARHGRFSTPWVGLE